MPPKIAINVTAQDKTQGGLDSAERRVGKFAHKTDGMAKQSGLARIGSQLDAVTKLGRSTGGLSNIGRGLSLIGSSAKIAGGGLAEATAP